MDQVFEFVGNHPLLFMAFFGTLGMLIFTEYTRVFSGVKALSPYEVTQKLNDGEALFLDVRPEADYKKGHVLNAMSFPVNNIDQRMHEVEKYKEREVIVYCDNGMISSRATAKLKRQGFAQLFSMAGGLAAWEKANLPIVSK